MKDVDFAYRQVLVRDGKGARDRVTMLPRTGAAAAAHLGKVRALHGRDLKDGFGEVRLPVRARAQVSARRARMGVAVHVSLRQSLGRSRGRRHAAASCPPGYISRAVSRAARSAGIEKRVSCHTLRHSFATHCSGAATTSAPCRSCSATRTCRRR